jgi:hypothetical protein
VAGVLGITVHALASVLPGRPYEALFSAGAKRPGILGRFVAARLFWYSRLHPLRPLCSLAFAPTAVKALSVEVGVGERAVFGRRRK